MKFLYQKEISFCCLLVLFASFAQAQGVASMNLSVVPEESTEVISNEDNFSAFGKVEYRAENKSMEEMAVISLTSLERFEKGAPKFLVYLMFPKSECSVGNKIAVDDKWDTEWLEKNGAVCKVYEYDAEGNIATIYWSNWKEGNDKNVGEVQLRYVNEAKVEGTYSFAAWASGDSNVKGKKISISGDFSVPFAE